MNRFTLSLPAIGLALGLAAAVVTVSGSDAFAQTKVLFEQRASDGAVTDSFEAQGLFEIRWRATGGQFLVKVLDENDREIMASAPQSREDEQAPMVGMLPHSGPGAFKLSVEASGPWHVRVTSAEE